MEPEPPAAGIRPAVVDGIFYPSEPARLRSLIEQLLSRSTVPPGRAFSIISPHASYSYAGGLMASAFKSASLRPVQTVVLIGPMHRDPADGIVLPESKAYSTPFGVMEVNREKIEELLSCSTRISRNDAPHLEEHCLEVQLPFVHYFFPAATIVPMLIGESGMQNIRLLANALQLTFSSAYRYILIVLSANMSSYMKGRDTERESQTLARLIRECDWQGIAFELQNKRISSCGAAAIAAVLSLNREGFRTEFLEEGDSLRMNGRNDQRVHYAAVSIHDEEEVKWSSS